MSLASYEIPNFYVGVLPADVDMSGFNGSTNLQFQGICVRAGVNLGGDAALCPVASTSNPIIGILQNNPIQGEAGVVMVEGVSKGKLGGAVAIGDNLACANGLLTKATTGQVIVGVALETGVLNDIIPVLLQRNGKA